MKQTKTLVTAKRLREVLSYDLETGVFTWKPRPAEQFSSDKSCKTWNTRFAGKHCGCIDSERGYVLIRVDGEQYFAHRLAWLFVTGVWPKNEVDHRNGIRSDNRWLNLRDVTPGVNRQNRRAPSRSAAGALGVSINKKTGRFESRIRTPGGGTQHLGTFSTVEAAHAAYVAAKRRMHEGCTL